MAAAVSLGVLALIYAVWKSQERAAKKPKKKATESPSPGEEAVAILDAGSQFAKVIDRKIRELNVACYILPFDTDPKELRQYQAIVISGGPDSVFSKDAPKYNPAIFELGVPVLGICYGMQAMAHRAGGVISREATREDGQFDIGVSDTESPIFAKMGKTLSVLLTHGDSVVDPGKGFKVTARSQAGVIAAIENREKGLYGLQFHPEVDLTVRGKEILRNFLYGVAKCSGKYTPINREEKALKEIRETIGKKKVLCLVSGGVDSSVCAALLRKALPKEQLFAMHVDSGFMRADESKNVMVALKKLDVDVNLVDASSRFFNGTTTIEKKGQPAIHTDKLKCTLNPEHKRKIIGNQFVHETTLECQRLKLKEEDVILAQGTLRPDLIESASTVVNKGHSDCIKTHHNDTNLIRRLRAKGRIIEPLKDYHKDEVRKLGKSLGLPDHLVERQPFPGPGLAIRVICTEKPYTTPDDPQILEKLKAFETSKVKISLLAFRTVGVQGDGRSYKACVALSTNSKPNWTELFALAKKIPMAVHGVNRVVFLFGKAISGHQTDITPTYCTEETVEVIRAADKEVNDLLYKHKLVRPLSQVPVVLFPCSFGKKGNRSVCIRPFMTNDFMTGVPAMIGKDFPVDVLEEMVARVTAVPGVSRMAYDLTSKPPGTTEWE